MGSGKVFIIAGVFALAVFLVSALGNKAFARVTKNMEIRGTDGYGSGAFGSSRDGGTRPHEGLDIIAATGQDIFSPISGTITRMAYPYSTDLAYKGLEIVSGKYVAKIFYILPTVAIGSTIKAGQVIGKAQNIAARYPGIENHVHFEVRTTSGQLLNPTNMF